MDWPVKRSEPIGYERHRDVTTGEWLYRPERPDHLNCWSHVPKEEAGVGSSKPQKLTSFPTAFSITTHSTPARSSAGPTCFVQIMRNRPLLCCRCSVTTLPGS